MTIATKFLALVNGVISQFSPVTVSAGSASAGGIVGLNGNGLLDPSLSGGAQALSASSAVTAAQYGYVFNHTASGITTTLPAPTSAAAEYVFWNNSAGNTSLSTPSGDFTGPAAYGLGTYYSTFTLFPQTGFRLVADGTNWQVYLLSSPAMTLVFNSSGSGTLPPWARMYRVRGTGGGGSGGPGGPIPPGGSGSGGAGGGTAVYQISDWQPISELASLSYTVSVAAGGAVAPPGGVGNTGGTSTANIGGINFNFFGCNGTAGQGVSGAASPCSIGGNSAFTAPASGSAKNYGLNFSVAGGVISSALGVAAACGNTIGAPGPGGAGGGINAGVFQPGGSSNYVFSNSDGGFGASGGSTAGAAGANGSTAQTLPFPLCMGVGGGGGAGNTSGPGGNGGNGNQAGAGGGGGGSVLTAASTTQSGAVTGGNTLTVASATGITNGMYVWDLTTPSAIPANTTMTISGTTVTTSATVASASGNTLVFGLYLPGSGGAGGNGAIAIDLM